MTKIYNYNAEKLDMSHPRHIFIKSVDPLNVTSLKYLQICVFCCYKIVTVNYRVASVTQEQNNLLVNIAVIYNKRVSTR